MGTDFLLLLLGLLFYIYTSGPFGVCIHDAFAFEIYLNEMY
jgi:hypothetical protein